MYFGAFQIHHIVKHNVYKQTDLAIILNALKLKVKLDMFSVDVCVRAHASTSIVSICRKCMYIIFQYFKVNTYNIHIFEDEFALEYIFVIECCQAY